MQFQVTIDFRKGPSYSTEIDALDAREAKEWALVSARANGFDAPIKKITARTA